MFSLLVIDNCNILLHHRQISTHTEHWMAGSEGAAIYAVAPFNAPSVGELLLPPEKAIRALRKLLRPIEGWVVRKINADALALLEEWHAAYPPEGDELDGPADMDLFFQQMRLSAEQPLPDAAKRIRVAFASIRAQSGQDNKLEPTGEYYFYATLAARERFDGYLSLADAAQAIDRLGANGYGNFSAVYQYHADRYNYVFDDPDDLN